MLYYIKRQDAEGEETAYVTSDRMIAKKLEKGDVLEVIDSLTLKDIVGRIKFGGPKINGSGDKRYPGTIVSQDVGLLDAYFEEAKSLQLDRFDPQRVTFEEQKEKYSAMLDRT